MSVTFFPSDAGDESPQLNVANGNVTIIFDILGFAYEGEDIYCGSIENADLKRYLKNVITADLRGMSRETNKVANVYFCGVTNESVARYQETLIKIIGYCIAFDKSLSWG